MASHGQKKDTNGLPAEEDPWGDSRSKSVASGSLSTGIPCEKPGCDRRNATAVYDWDRAHHDHEFGNGAWSYYCPQHRKNRNKKRKKRRR